jgi:MFS family permease
VIFPFITQFVRETGVTGGDERKIGYFAGMIESSFFLAEAMTVLGWGMASDRYGRRPVLLWGPFGLSIAMLGFGMSSSFTSLLIFRCLQGAFNGNIGVSKAVISELTDSTNIADAFAIMPFMWSMGDIIGPTLGGLLSRPADRWPSTLGRLPYLESHPYFLPCLFASAIAFTSFLVGLVALKETSPLIARARKQWKNSPADQTHSAPTSSTTLMSNNDIVNYGSNGGSRREEGTIPDSETCAPQEGSDEPKPTAFRGLLTRDVIVVVVNYATFLSLSLAFDVLIPLMWSTSLENGGLGFTPYKIGSTMGIYGVVNAFFQLSSVGRIIKRFGPKRVYSACAASLLLAFGGFPVASFFAQRAGGADWRVWSVIALQLYAKTMGYASYGAMQVMIQGVAPTRSDRGAINGLAQAVASVSRSFAPAVASSLFAISLQENLAGGKGVYYIMLAIVASGIPLTFLLPENLRLDSGLL